MLAAFESSSSLPLALRSLARSLEGGGERWLLIWSVEDASLGLEDFCSKKSAAGAICVICGE